jgi:hypothetical protein
MQASKDTTALTIIKDTLTIVLEKGKYVPNCLRNPTAHYQLY